MSVNLITGDGAVSSLKTLNMSVSDQAVKKTPLQYEHLLSQTVQSNAAEANFNNKVSPVNKQSPESGIESRNKPIREMSHVVEVYNLQGKARTKFMDSNNDVIYQIPSEMVAKLEDQMMNPDTSTSTKG